MGARGEVWVGGGLWCVFGGVGVVVVLVEHFWRSTFLLMVVLVLWWVCVGGFGGALLVVLVLWRGCVDGFGGAFSVVLVLVCGWCCVLVWS